MRIFATAAAVLSLTLAGSAHAQLKKVDGVLVDAAGMTVYTFDKDSAGKSACSGPCIQNWPAVPAPDKVSEPYSVVTRDDGSKQLAYKGKPLYLFAKDAKPGERTGDNFKDVWHVVKD
ncbi:COG4315 family predicted lipoprotein [Pseudoduganella namucuonensis]|uniref:Predicted lipoprotein with conserved Yx(FWY)xxD motif n=1 Tax=Pseudoduganella namucuonensis TaxID=1035707 RepID=A0A1I7KBC2_9BURK|nr:hypothetical protein [Pseudoduganella namucuonensis]SFU94732.1 Predicted lipoprotein with conserved Yx(FWY)xxD motif [Pseudoduganella namucuonensis]